MPEGYLVDLEEYHAQLASINAEFNAKIAVLDSQIIALEVEIADIERQVSSWTAKVSGAQSEVNRLIGELNNVEARIGTVKGVWDKALECHRLGESDAPPEQIYACTEALADMVEIVFPGTVLSSTLRSKNMFFVLYATTAVINLCKDTTNSLNSQRATLQTELASAQSELSYYRSQLSSAQDALESRTRHMRDLQLAKEAVEEERRGAIALWQAEYEAAQERKRIELESIARDVILGYPEMDAATAMSIAEVAFAEALARGFTRVSDALTIAMDLAKEWSETHIFPHLTTKTVICSGCGATLELTISDIPEHNKQLTCPICGTNVGMGISLRVIEPGIAPTPAGAWDWLEKNWAYVVAVGILGTGVAVGLATKKKKKKKV